MQKASASDTKQTPCWPCICLRQVAKLNLSMSAAACNQHYSWFLGNSSESETRHPNRGPGDPHVETSGWEHCFSSSCSIQQLVCFVWFYSCLLHLQNWYQLLQPPALMNQYRDSSYNFLLVWAPWTLTEGTQVGAQQCNFTISLWRYIF